MYSVYHIHVNTHGSSTVTTEVVVEGNRSDKRYICLALMLLKLAGQRSNSPAEMACG